jgi:hypothetical protein
VDLAVDSLDALTLARVCTEMSLDAFSPWPWLSGLFLLTILLFLFTRGVLPYTEPAHQLVGTFQCSADEQPRHRVRRVKGRVARHRLRSGR